MRLSIFAHPTSSVRIRMVARQGKSAGLIRADTFRSSSYDKAIRIKLDGDWSVVYAHLVG